MDGQYKVAAADVGGTGGKIAVLGFDGARLLYQSEHTFPNREVFAGDSLYWDVLSLYADMGGGLTALRREAEIQTLGIDTWGVDFGLLDSRKKLMGNLYHMRDFRTKGIPEEVFGIIPERDLFYATASDCSRFYGLYQLYQTKQASPYILENARYLMFTPDLLNFYFTGETGKSDITMAGTSQLLDGSMTEWCHDVLRKLSIPTHYLGGLGYPGEYTGKTPEGIKVIRTAGHDSAAAVACVRPGAFYVSGGTYLVTGFKNDTTILNDAMLAHDFKNTTGPDGKYLAYKNVTGFWTLKEVMDEFASLGEPYTYGELVQLAEREEPFQSVVDINQFADKRPSMLGAIRDFCEKTGQQAPDTAGKMARCLYESYAMQVKDCYLAAIDIAGKRHDKVYVINGACKNALLCQMIADAAGVPVYAGLPRATIMGNAGIQLIAAGKVKGFGELCDLTEASEPYMVYEPKDAKRWEEEYSRLKPVVIGR